MLRVWRERMWAAGLNGELTVEACRAIVDQVVESNLQRKAAPKFTTEGATLSVVNFGLARVHGPLLREGQGGTPDLAKQRCSGRRIPPATPTTQGYRH